MIARRIWRAPAKVLPRRAVAAGAAASCDGAGADRHRHPPTVAAPLHLHRQRVHSLRTAPATSRRGKSTYAVDAAEEAGDGSRGGGPAAEGEALVADGYLGKILNAKVYDVAIETELQRAENLSDLLGNDVLLKREDTQPVFSFKIRGAYNKMASLPSASLARGVVACSAGNHAQGVALSARILGCRAVICMPLATPSIKVNAVRAHGGETVEVRLIGNNYDEAAREAKRLEYEEGLALIHPFDDPHVIAGQGTIGELGGGGIDYQESRCCLLFLGKSQRGYK